MQLRPHQEQALQSMLDNDKGQVIVPTGAVSYTHLRAHET